MEGDVSENLLNHTVHCHSIIIYFLKHYINFINVHSSCYYSQVCGQIFIRVKRFTNKVYTLAELTFLDALFLVIETPKN